MPIRLTSSLNLMKNTFARCMVVKNIKGIFTEVETGTTYPYRTIVGVGLTFFELKSSTLEVFVKTLVAGNY